MTSFREFRGEAWGNEAWKAMTRVRESQPLVQCITNFVSMDIMANTLLAAGASPAMVHAVEEITEFTALSNALCINIGTLSPNWIFSMKSTLHRAFRAACVFSTLNLRSALAARSALVVHSPLSFFRQQKSGVSFFTKNLAQVAATRANELLKPWVLDPVGVGATLFRTQKCIELIQLKPTVIRGNASEIMAVVGSSTGSTKGVDSTQASTDALEAAKELARMAQCVVVVSGAVDLVTDGKRVLGVSNGVALLQRITATGCAVTSLIAAFLSADPGRPLEAAAFALALFGIAAEIGNERADGPASLRVNMLDALHSLDEASVTSRIRIAQI